MPLPTPKGGVHRLAHDSTAGHRGLPARHAQSGGPQHLPAAQKPRGEAIGSDVRGGNTPVGIPGRKPQAGSGTGQ